MCFLLIYPLAFVVTGKCFFELAFMGKKTALLSVSPQEDNGGCRPLPVNGRGGVSQVTSLFGSRLWMRWAVILGSAWRPVKKAGFFLPSL